MKLKDLQCILRSKRDYIQFAIIYDSQTNTDIENGCSIDYAMKKYGEKEVIHIQAFENQLIITI